MARWRRLRGVAVLVTVLALLPAAAGAHEPEEERKRDVDSALAEQSRDLHESSVALRRASEALQRIAIQLPAARRRQAQAEARLVAARARHAELVAKARGARVVLRVAEEAVAAAEAQVEQSTSEIGSVVRSAYMSGPLSNAAAVLDAGDPQDLLERTVLLRSITGHQVEALNEHRRTRVELAGKRATLAQRRQAAEKQEAEAARTLTEVDQLARAAREARRSVERQIAEQAAARRVAEREKAADLARYRALQAESRRLAALIRAKQSRGNGQIGKGGLLWPTPGPVTSRYGYRTHPIYGTRRMHAGIDIGAPSGQAIVAVKAGRVVHAGAMGTYGNLVVVDHGNGFSTAYAHQTRVATYDGAQVRAGQVIGYVGSTGASTGPHLHYETRVNGEPVDPMRYY